MAKSTKEDEEAKSCHSSAPSTAPTTTTTEHDTNLVLGLTSFHSPSIAHFLYVLEIYRYVLLCLLFGAMSVILGVSMLSLSLVLRANTSSVNLLESVPLYMPGLILVCNGTSMIAFMNKNTRRFYLLKSVCGLFLLVALLLIIVSVTTSVIYLPRLHSHRECAYTQRLRACTCVQNPPTASKSSISSKHFTMEDINNCEIVHSLIYDSLRVVFALSLISILISIFSIMTLYQLYIHEKQKLFLNQTNSQMIRDQFNQSNDLLKSTSTNPDNQSNKPNNGNTSSSFFNNFNHLYPVGGSGSSGGGGAQNESKSFTQVKCLSAEFSSQDLLIDQSSTNFGVSIPENLSSRDRIWSSQSSNFANFNKTEFVDLSDQPLKIRRYMNVILEKSNNVQSYIREKFQTLKQMTSNSNDNIGQISDRLNRSRANKSKLLPPHVISRYSRKQYSMDSSNLSSNYPGLDHSRPSIANDHRDKSNSIYSSSSSSHKSTSASSSTKSSKHRHHSHHSHHTEQQPPSSSSILHDMSSTHLDHNHNSYLKDEDNLVKTSFNEEPITLNDNHLINVEPDCATAFNCPDVYYLPNVYMNGNQPQMSSVFNNNELENELPSMPYSVNQPDQHWSHSKILNTFQCIDEDDYSEQFKLPESQFSKLLRNNEVEFYTDSKQQPITPDTPLTVVTTTTISDQHQCTNQNEEPNLSPDEKVSEDTKFTFGSELNNIHYVTTFEEAFKNYYDSQNRISHQQSHYNTMPVKLSKERSKRTKSNNNHQSNYRLEQHQQQFREPFESVQPPSRRVNKQTCQPMFAPPTQVLVQENVAHLVPQIAQINLTANLIMSDDEVPFPAIEPPPDYKNVATADNDDHIVKDNPNQTALTTTTVPPLDNQPNTTTNLQPFQFWVQQFIDQINRTQLIDTAKIYNPTSINDYDDSVVNGFVDEDDEDDEVDIEDEDEEDDDDDGAGDTSTSQDIADFEFELDEEPIKFIGDEEYKTKIDTQVLVRQKDTIIKQQQPKTGTALTPIITNLSVKPQPHLNQHRLEPSPAVVPAAPLPQSQPDGNSNNLLKNNTNLIKRTVQLNKLTADYGFDGFRKGCFGDGEDDSSTSSSSSSNPSSNSNSTNSSSLANAGDNRHPHHGPRHHHGHHHNHHNHHRSSGSKSSNSITAEFIKPPTPFTNYYTTTQLNNNVNNKNVNSNNQN